MALVFSKVTIDTDGESVEFLVSGSPLHGIELYGWIAYEDFIKAHPNANEARIQPYYPACYRMTEAGRLLPSSVRFLTWGTMSRGRFLTARILEFPNPERECILSDILESDAPEKYFLSEKQMQRLLCKLSPDEKETESTPQEVCPSPSQATQAVSEEKQDSTM